MLPDKETAEQMLVEAEKRNPGPWGNHSRTVAECAEKIAAQAGLDSGKAYIVGLLHDIGRREGVTNFRHIIDGYHYLNGQGYNEAAKICLTHSFCIPDIHMHIGTCDLTEEEYQETVRLLSECEYDDYDRLIQLCDSIALPQGPVDLATRMGDVKRRYGHYPEAKWQKNFELKEYFDRKTGNDVYKIVGAKLEGGDKPCQEQSL